MRKSSADPLSGAKNVFSKLKLPQVPPSSWSALREADSTFSLDLDVSIDHLREEDFHDVANSIKAIGKANLSESFWEWMALSSESDNAISSVLRLNTEPVLPRAKALVALLGQAIGSGSTAESSAVAAAAYLALLELEGAEQSWGTIFQPAIFHRVLCVLRPLSTESRRRAVPLDTGASQAAGADDADCDMEAPTQEAIQLLELLVAFLRTRLISSSQEVVTMVIDHLVSLVAYPTEEVVASNAAKGLKILVAGAGKAEEVRRIAAMVIRAVLPALLMSQEGGASHGMQVPPRLQQARAAAMDLVSALVCTHPELLVQGPVHPSAAVRERRVEGPDDDEAATSDEETQNAESLPRGTRRRTTNKNGIDDPILAMMQLMCLQAPERAEWRAAAAEGVVALLCKAVESEGPSRMRKVVKKVQSAHEKSSVLDRLMQERVSFLERFLAFVEKLFRSERGSYRGIAADVATAVLGRSTELLGSAADGEERANFDARLLRILLRHCYDVTPTVRSRALGGVAAAMQSLAKYPEGVQLLRTALCTGARDAEAAAGDSASESPLRLDISGIFRSASNDDKALARRAGLTFLETSLMVLSTALSYSQESVVDLFDMELVKRLANDESVLVRKAVISILGLLLRACPTVPRAMELWAMHVPPLASDVEVSVIEKATQEIDAAILRPLSRIGRGGHSDIDHDSGKALGLPAVLWSLDAEATEYLKRALQSLSRQEKGTSTQQLATTLLEVVRKCLRLPVDSWPPTVWPMLEELATMGATPKGRALEVVLDAWEVCDKDQTRKSMRVRAKILSVLAQVMPHLPCVRASKFRDRLREKLDDTLDIAVDDVGPMLRILEHSPDSDRISLQLLRSLDSRLCSCVASLSSDGSEERVAEVRACMLVLGEMALSKSTAATAISSSAISAVQTIATNNSGQVKMDTTTRSFAFACLGKLCLQREDLAKKSVELFVLHLSSHESFAIRNNVLVVLSDLCVHYTALVERFVACMADLLRDPNVLLRKHAAMVLCSLLSENYIKFRGPIVYRFLYVLSDPSDSVRNVVECVCVRILHQRHNAMFKEIFLDVVCALTGWTGHPDYRGAVGNKEFVLASNVRRTMIYQFMLSLMTNDQKHQVCLQIVTQFLASFIEAEKRIELPSVKECPGGKALHDVLWLLVCKEMRICFSPKQAGEAVEETDQDGSAGVEAARSEIWRLHKVMMCNNVAPVLIQMKKRMEEQRSPFLGQLRHCLCEILREFKDDLKDILADDLQLAGEVEYDLEATQRSSPTRGGPRKRTSLLRLMGDTPPPPLQNEAMADEIEATRNADRSKDGRHVPTPQSTRRTQKHSEKVPSVRGRLKRKTVPSDLHSASLQTQHEDVPTPACTPTQADVESQGTVQPTARRRRIARQG